MLFCLLWSHLTLIHSRVSVVYSVQSWLAETPEQKKTSTTPAYFSVGMARKHACDLLKATSLILSQSCLSLS